MVQVGLETDDDRRRSCSCLPCLLSARCLLSKYFYHYRVLYGY